MPANTEVAFLFHRWSFLTVQSFSILLTDLFAAGTVLGKLLLMAASAVHLITLGQEALAADWLLALKADETLFMPDFMLVLHILSSYGETPELFCHLQHSA